MAPDRFDVRPEDVLRGASSLAIDSRNVQPGSVFVALRGVHTDGHRFIDDAIARGATTIVMERPMALPESVRGIVVRDSARALSKLASVYYGAPAQALTMIGVTGTNGKTTTTQMIASILNGSAMCAAVIGTLGASFGTDHWPLANTTPLAPELHAMLANLRDRGAKAVAMEVSSHALALRRVADIEFKTAALTNVTRDHLDFHETFEAYAAAKHSLFDAAETAVFNRDDVLGAKWAAERSRPQMTYSLHGDADIVARDLELRADGSTFTVDGQRFKLRIPGRFNVSNALAAIGVARVLKIDDAAAARGLAALQQVPGRMEHLSGGGINVVVDYAHTPDALQNALRTLRETTQGKLFVVFGAGGDRDRGKRPQMGKIAAEHADRVIITSDNPRTEDPRLIAAEIAAGLNANTYELILDRRDAINAAVRAAQAGDVILIAGKGHEAYQILGEETIPFDDRVIAREAFEALS